MEALIEVANLVMDYQGVRAVDGVSLTIKRGICFGLLGPNGAGKTTTVEILEGIKQPTSGTVLYKGAPLGSSFHHEAGIMFQSTALQEFITVRETLEMFQRFYDKQTAMDALIAACSLSSFLDRDTRKISGGQRQRLLLAIALINDPDVIFLDEPTTGLDPQARRNIWELVRNIKARGKTVLLTTHYMEEAYELCDEIVIMDRGRIIAEGSPDALLAAHFSDVVLQLPREDFTAAAEALPLTVYCGDDTVEILTCTVTDTLRALLDVGVSLDRLRVRSRTLDDLFLELTGKELRP